VICVLERLEPSDLPKLQPVVRWWMKKGNPAPLLFALDELRRSADVFAIELLDIKARRRVLFGEDIFADLEVPMGLHRAQVEFELRRDLTRLRQRYLALVGNGKRTMQLMARSVATFVVLFRHALIALGEQPPDSRREIADKIAAAVGCDPSPLHQALDFREGKPLERTANMEAIFASYLDIVRRIIDEVDRRLA
jgi:hypothetical protein